MAGDADEGVFSACFDEGGLSPVIKRVDVDGVPGAFVLRGVLSEGECTRLEGGVRRLHALADTHSVEANELIMKPESSGLARRDSQHHVPCQVPASVVAPLSRRLRPWLEVTPGEACESAAKLAPSDDHAVSSFFRCYLYKDGDCSTPHFDRSFRVHKETEGTTSEGVKGGQLVRFSAYSLLLYLNDDFEGMYILLL